MNDYANVLNRAEMLVKLAEVERRGREFGRREADKNLLNVTGWLDLSMRINKELLEIVERWTFEAYELNSIKMGIELLEGFRNEDIGNRPSPTRCCGQCAGCGEGADTVRNTEG